MSTVENVEARFNELYDMTRKQLASLLNKKLPHSTLSKETACFEILRNEFGAELVDQWMLWLDQLGDLK